MKKITEKVVNDTSKALVNVMKGQQEKQGKETGIRLISIQKEF